jgi:hypothetical protein
MLGLGRPGRELGRREAGLVGEDDRLDAIAQAELAQDAQRLVRACLGARLRAPPTGERVGAMPASVAAP